MTSIVLLSIVFFLITPAWTEEVLWAGSAGSQRLSPGSEQPKHESGVSVENQSINEFLANKLATTYRVIDFDQYKLGPGDIVLINFWGIYNASSMSMVSAEGEIYVAVLGELNVMGRTIAQAEEILARAAALYYSPQVKTGLSLLTVIERR